MALCIGAFVHGKCEEAIEGEYGNRNETNES